MIHLEAQENKIVQGALAKYPYRFYVFGSRATGKNRQFSDLDLCYLESISPRDLSNILTEFEESDLPFKVDMVDFNKCSKDFQGYIKKNMVSFEIEKNSLNY